MPHPADRHGSALLEAGACILEFEQFRQSYRLIRTVARLPDGDPVRQAAIWHNRLFNPALPDAVLTLAFQPDRTAAEASPHPR